MPWSRLAVLLPKIDKTGSAEKQGSCREGTVRTSEDIDAVDELLLSQ